MALCTCWERQFQSWGAAEHNLTRKGDLHMIKGGADGGWLEETGRDRMGNEGEQGYGGGL